VGLVKERRCVPDERVLEVWLELCPRSWAQRHGLDELLGGTGMVSGPDALDHGANPPADFLQHRGRSRVTGEQRDQRRLVRDDPSQEVGPLASQPERDRRAKRVSADPRRREPQVLDQRREIGNILADAPLVGRTLAFAVTPPVVGEKSK
jgi:hypothetical protein